jgi:hypothetical protein
VKYRKKPVVIEAMQVIDDLRNHVVIAEWINSNGGEASLAAFQPWIFIETLEGQMRAVLGDYVIRGVAGEFYPCKPDIFAATYEAEGTAS